MGLGEASKDIPWAPGPEPAFEAVKAALDEIGHITYEVPPSQVDGRTRAGLQRVEISVTITETPEGSMLHCEAFADDVWGGGARIGLRKLTRALERQAAG